MALISHRTKSKNSMQSNACGDSYLKSQNFFISENILIYRHLYVADLFDHNVHVLEVEDDNALVSVKVNYFMFQH